MPDTFTEKAPKEIKPKTNPIPRGRSGTLVSGAQIQDDYKAELLGTEGQKKYEKMSLSDSAIRKLIHAVNNPIKSATWDIEPASDDPKHLEQAALMKQIIFDDMPDGFTGKLDEILDFPWKGHAVFEIVTKNRFKKGLGNYTGLLNLAFRAQDTLDKWNFSNAGILESIHQLQNGDIPVNETLPIDTLLIFYNEKKGNNSGYPFCRMLYGNYKRKLLYKQLQAIGIERAALPVPHLEVPENISHEDDSFIAAQEQLEAFTEAEQAYFMTPAGYKLNYFQTGTYDPKKVQAAIKAENEEIAGSLVAMWLEMGIGGNSAVGSSTGISAEAFKDGIEYLANKIADKYNLQLIPYLSRLNFAEELEVYPKLVHNGIADEAGKELMEIITGYTKEGVITTDESLEDFARKAHNFPKKVEGEMVDNKKAQDETNTPPGNSNDDNTPNGNGDKSKEEEETNLATTGKAKTPPTLIISQGKKVADSLTEGLTFSGAKYINDVMVRYRQLPEAKKQNATNKTIMGGTAKLKKALQRDLAEAAALSIEMARKEVPSKSEIQLKDYDRDMVRMSEKFKGALEVKLNDYSDLPAYMQVLVQKQSDLISNASTEELKNRIDFSYSSIQTQSADEKVIRQAMEESADEFTNSNRVVIKGNNSAAMVVNEGRDAFFFQPDVLEEIHSFTFMNIAPVAAVCKELAGTTFNTNDATSLRYSPPLHHNCKSYLRANLKVSKGVDELEVSTLSPSAEAIKTVTL